MTAVTIPIVGAERTIIFPVIFSTLKELKKIYQIPDDTTIQVPSSTGSISYCTIDGKPLGNQNPSTDVDNKFKIEYTLEDVEESVSNTTDYQDYHRWFFNDKTIGFMMRPVYKDIKLNLTITYESRNKSTLTNYKNRHRLKVSKTNVAYHSLEYKFIVPKSLTKLLKKIFDLKESNAPYDIDYADYLNEYSDDRLILSSTSNANQIDLSVKEIQTRVMGMLDNSISNEMEYDKEKSKWSLNIDYSITFQMPFAVYARYPIIVHNQLLPREYASLVSTIPVDDFKTALEDNQIPSMRFFQDYLMGDIARGLKTLISPITDDFIYDYNPVGMKTITTVLCMVDNSDKRAVCNLGSLGYINLNDGILEWLRQGEYAHIKKLYQSILYLDLIEDEQALNGRDINIDSDLNITTNFDMLPRSIYHLRLSYTYEFHHLRAEARERILADSTIKDVLKDSYNKINHNHQPMIGTLGNQKTFEEEFDVFQMLPRTQQIMSITVFNRDLLKQQMEI